MHSCLLLQIWTLLQGFSFHTILMWMCGLLVHSNKNCIKYQILIGIISTFSENFIQIIQIWPQLQPKTWSEAIFRMYTSLHHFIIDSLQKCILEAAFDRLDIQLGTNSPFDQDWISRQSITASKMHSENGLGSHFRL